MTKSPKEDVDMENAGTLSPKAELGMRKPLQEEENRLGKVSKDLGEKREEATGE